MSAATLAGKKVFIVEDSASNLSITATTLRQAGATVIFDVMGFNTLEQLRQYPNIDVILLDLNLREGTSGFDIYEEIKAQPELSHIPIVAVSAMDPATGMHETRLRGFNGFIGKPIDTEQFAEQIAAVLDGEEVWYAL